MIDNTPKDETLQLSGLSQEKKQDIKTQAIKRNVSASQLLVVAYDEYVKRYPAS